MKARNPMRILIALLAVGYLNGLVGEIVVDTMTQENPWQVETMWTILWGTEQGNIRPSGEPENIAHSGPFVVLNDSLYISNEFIGTIDVYDADNIFSRSIMVSSVPTTIESFDNKLFVLTFKGLLMEHDIRAGTSVYYDHSDVLLKATVMLNYTWSDGNRLVIPIRDPHSFVKSSSVYVIDLSSPNTCRRATQEDVFSQLLLRDSISGKIIPTSEITVLYLHQEKLIVRYMTESILFEIPSNNVWTLHGTSGVLQDDEDELWQFYSIQDNYLYYGTTSHEKRLVRIKRTRFP